jgi:hypothetical protein
MTTHRAADLARRFAECKRRRATVPGAENTSSPGQLLDTLVRDRLLMSRGRTYREVMLEILAADRELAELYAL